MQHEKITKRDASNPMNYSPSCILRQLVTLMNDPMSAKLIDRHILLLDDLIMLTVNGFWAYDLPYITELIDILLERMEAIPELNRYLDRILERCAISLQLTSFSELLYLQQHLEEFFSFLGCLLVRLNDVYLRNLTVKIIYSLLDPKRRVCNRIIPVKFCSDALERSNLPEILSILLEICVDTFYVELLRITSKIANISRDICLRILKEDVLHNVMRKLKPDNKEVFDIELVHKKLPKNLQEQTVASLKLLSILLNAMRSASSLDTEEIKTPRLEALLGLKFGFKLLVTSDDKAERNFCMSILLGLMDLFPSALILHSGIGEDLCILSVGTEITFGASWASEVHLAADALDFEFKRMLLLAIYYITRFDGTYKLIIDNQVISGILQIISPNKSHIWCKDHMTCLKLAALNILERIMPTFAEEFIQKNGLIKIISMMDFYVKSPFSLEKLIATLKCFNKLLLESKNQELLSMCTQNSLHIILNGLMDSLVSKKHFSAGAQKALTIVYSILVIFVHINDKSYNKQHIDKSMVLMKRFLHPEERDVKLDSGLIICVFNFLWELVCIDDCYTKHFVHREGVYLLLDIISDAPFPMKIVGLGLIVEICEEGTAIPYLVTWRKNMTSLLPMLLKIFREESKLIGMETTERGVIKDADYPLLGTVQKSKLNVCTPESPAMTDMECSCRPKIYALTQLLSLRHKDKVDVANDYYKIYGYNLSIDDKITKVLTDNFLALKLGEIWMELKKELTEMNIEVVDFDKFLIDILISHYKKWGTDIQQMQNMWIEIEKTNEYITEEEFYNLLREGRLGAALEGLAEMKFLARTTECIFRLTAKMTENTGISDPEVHRTYNTTLRTTIIHKQKIAVKSDGMIEQDNNSAPDLVSPIETLANISCFKDVGADSDSSN